MRMLNRLLGRDSGGDVVDQPVEGYCFKCKDRRQIAGASMAYTKNGKPRVHGNCAVCNTRMSKLVKL